MQNYNEKNTRELQEKHKRKSKLEAFHHSDPKKQIDNKTSNDTDSIYYQLFEHNINAVLLTCPDGTVHAANPAACKLFGRTEDDIKKIGRNGLVDLANPRLKDAIKEWEQTGKFDGELTFIRKDGTIFPGILTSSVFNDKDGNLRTCITIQDITEHIKAMEQIKISEIRYRELFEHMPSGVAVYDVIDGGKDFIFKDFNHSGELFDKQSRTELIGKSIFEVRPGAEKFGLIEAFRKAVKSGKPVHHPIRLYKDNRLTSWYNNYIYTLPSGELVAVFDDVTEKKLAEEALHENENLLNEVGRIAKIGGWEMDLITQKSKWTKGAYDIVEIDYDKPIPEPDEHLDYYFPEYRPIVEKAINDLIEKDIPMDIETKGRTTKGNVRWFHAVGRAIRENGACIKIFGTLQDITERKKIEARIFRYQQELKSLASQLTLTEEKERYRIATHLHDHIGQYLAVSRMKLVELLNSEISEGTYNTLKLVDEWLYHSIKETRSLTFDLSSPILHELGIKKAIESWLDDEIRKKYQIETEFYCNRPHISLEDDIQVVLFRNVRELLFNVVKHAKASKIKIAIETKDNNIQIIVEDDGVGFNPVEITETAPGKSQFGLFSIRERLEHFGGNIKIETAAGQGCKITLTVPMKKD